MIVDEIRLRSVPLNTHIAFHLDLVPLTDPYILKAATGLDAGSIRPINYGYGYSGSRFYDMTQEDREVVLRIGLNPEYYADGTRQDLRELIYKMIAADRESVLYLDLWSSDEYIASVQGFVERVESSYFTAKPEVQLTLSCPQPLFKPDTRTVVDVDAFTDEYFTVNVTNGTAPTGFTAIFEVLNDLPNGFGISNDVVDWSFQIGHEFLAGDLIHFSSELNERDIYVLRPSSVNGENDGITKLADKLVDNPIWPILFPGENNFVVGVPPTDFDYVSLEYYPAYWGV